MAMKKQVTGYSIHVEPRRLGDMGGISVPDSSIAPDESRQLALYHERCKEITRDIQRHVDNVRSATVEVATEQVCEHCGACWTEDGTAYNGGCCDADEDANPAG